MRPHRRQPTRLPRPWGSPGKNTGVGCHFLLQCMKVKSESEVTQSCPILSDPMDCTLPGSSAHGILQARVLEWDAITFSENNNDSLISIHYNCTIIFCNRRRSFNFPASVHHDKYINRFCYFSLVPIPSVRFSSVRSCPTLCNPVNCSTPGLLVHHQLPESTQTHVH